MSNGWIEHLITCPSQCYFFIEFKGVRYCLYLRWRHNDPWQGHIIQNATGDGLLALRGDFSKDLFHLCGYRFKHEEYKEAQNKLMALWDQFVLGKFKVQFRDEERQEWTG